MRRVWTGVATRAVEMAESHSAAPLRRRVVDVVKGPPRHCAPPPPADERAHDGAGSGARRAAPRAWVDGAWSVANL